MPRVVSWLTRPSLLRTVVARVRLSARLLREPRVPSLLKVLPVAAVAYLVLPLDFAPDFLPILGQLDDIGLMVVALEAFLHLSPVDAVEYHRRAIAEGRKYSPMPPGGEFIDAEFRHT